MRKRLIRSRKRCQRPPFRSTITHGLAPAAVTPPTGTQQHLAAEASLNTHQDLTCRSTASPGVGLRHGAFACNSAQFPWRAAPYQVPTPAAPNTPRAQAPPAGHWPARDWPDGPCPTWTDTDDMEEHVAHSHNCYPGPTCRSMASQGLTSATEDWQATAPSVQPASYQFPQPMLPRAHLEVYGQPGGGLRCRRKRPRLLQAAVFGRDGQAHRVPPRETGNYSVGEAGGGGGGGGVGGGVDGLAQGHVGQAGGSVCMGERWGGEDRGHVRGRTRTLVVVPLELHPRNFLDYPGHCTLLAAHDARRDFHVASGTLTHREAHTHCHAPAVVRGWSSPGGGAAPPHGPDAMSTASAAATPAVVAPAITPLDNANPAAGKLALPVAAAAAATRLPKGLRASGEYGGYCCMSCGGGGIDLYGGQPGGGGLDALQSPAGGGGVFPHPCGGGGAPLLHQYGGGGGWAGTGMQSPSIHTAKWWPGGRAGWLQLALCPLMMGN